MTRVPFIPRSADEQILDMLALRDRKLTCVQIAAQMGLTKGVVAGALSRVDREYAASEAEQ